MLRNLAVARAAFTATCTSPPGVPRTRPLFAGSAPPRAATRAAAAARPRPPSSAGGGARSVGVHRHVGLRTSSRVVARMTPNPMRSSAAASNPSESGIVPEYRVLYFDAPTRGEQVRLLFVVTDTPFTDERFKFPGGITQFKQATLGDGSPLAFDQVPCVQYTPHGRDGSVAVSVNQTAACMQYVGTKLGLSPGTPEGDATALSFTLGAEEARNSVFYGTLIPVVVLKFVVGFGAARAFTRWWRKARFHRWMGFFERQLRLQSATTAGKELHLAGSALSYADVAVFDLVQGILDVGAFTSTDLAKDYPLLHQFVGQMRDHPQLSTYLKKRGPILKALGLEK